MSDAIVAFEESFGPKLKLLLKDVRNTSGKESAKVLRAQLNKRHQRTLALGYRLAKEPVSIKDWDFDATNPEAKKWIEEHAAETLADLSQTTRDAVRDLLDHAFDGEYDVDHLTDEIADLIGDAARADLIARTETMTASNEGQQEAWEQAIESGLLTGNEKRAWIVTPDDRLCPICEPMEGVEVGMDEAFDVDGDQVDEPPAHPRCRCTMGLQL